MTVEPAFIDDSLPTEDEIAAAVKKLRRNRSGGPSRICAEHIKGWLAAAKRGVVAEEKGKGGLPPAPAMLERITAERTELYSQVPSPGENIPVTVEPALIDNSVPTEDEIAAAVKKLRRNRSGEPSRIRAEHIKGWLAAARRGGVAEEKGKEKTEVE